MINAEYNLLSLRSLLVLLITIAISHDPGAINMPYRRVIITSQRLLMT